MVYINKTKRTYTTKSALKMSLNIQIEINSFCIDKGKVSKRCFQTIALYGEGRICVIFYIFVRVYMFLLPKENPIRLVVK